MSNKRSLHNWIPYHKELSRKEEVLLIAADTGMTVWEVSGRLMDFWAFADSNFCPDQNGQMSIRKRTFVPLMSTICPENFVNALVECGWLIENGDHYIIPNADRFLGESSKKRLKDAERKRNDRSRPQETSEKRPISNGQMSEIKRTKSGLEKEKEKEKDIEDSNKKNCSTELNESDRQADEVWKFYPRKQGKKTALTKIKAAIKRHGYEKILEATEAYGKARENEDPCFTPMPHTWFNQERFLDDPSTWVVKPRQETSGKGCRAADASRDKGDFENPPADFGSPNENFEF
jgi:hypothetical protein